MRAVHNQADSWSIGWRWHPERIFDLDKLRGFLSTTSWRRAKGVIHAVDKWVSINAVDNVIPQWQASEWRRDSRLELIFVQPQDEGMLDQLMRGCL
jgi:hypothetical protein